MVPFNGPVDVLDNSLGGERPAALDVLENPGGVTEAPGRRIVERRPGVRRGDATEPPATAVGVDLADNRLYAPPLVDVPDFFIGAVRVKNDISICYGIQMRNDSDVFAGIGGECLGGFDGLLSIGESTESLAVLGDSER